MLNIFVNYNELKWLDFDYFNTDLLNYKNDKLKWILKIKLNNLVIG